MLRILLWTVTTALLAVNAAPTNSTTCLEKCLEDRREIVDVNDLWNFRKTLSNLETLCKKFDDLSNCAQDCPEQAGELVEKSAIAERICQWKDLSQVKKCSSQIDENLSESCSQSCGINENSTTALRFDSSPTSAINPQAEMTSIGSDCRQQICVLQCSSQKLQDQCTAASELFRELIKLQISSGSIKLGEDQRKQYFDALPEECAFLKHQDSLEKLFPIDSSTPIALVSLEKEPTDASTSEPETNPLPANSGEFTMSEAIDGVEKKQDEAKLASKEDETPAPPLIISDTAEGEGEESDEEMKELNKERKPDEPFLLASRDTKPEEETKDERQPHVFQPEDDFVPFGSPANITEEAAAPVTENPAVAMAEEDVKIVNQPASIKPETVQLSGEADSEEEVTPKMDVLNSEEKIEQPQPPVNGGQADDEKEIAEGMEKMEEAIKKESQLDESEKEDEEKEEKVENKEINENSGEKQETTTEAILIVDAGQMEKDPKKNENDLSQLITQSPEMVSSSSSLTLGSITLFIAFFMTP